MAPAERPEVVPLRRPDRNNQLALIRSRLSHANWHPSNRADVAVLVAVVDGITDLDELVRIEATAKAGA